MDLVYLQLNRVVLTVLIWPYEGVCFQLNCFRISDLSKSVFIFIADFKLYKKQFLSGKRIVF